MGARIVLVAGGTGRQGGSLAGRLLRDPRYRVRALTRTPESEAARALASAGAEVIRGDLGHPLQLRRALEGCHAVFGVTPCREGFGFDAHHALSLIDAVVDSEVEHLVFSSGRPARRGMQGARIVQDRIRAAGIPATWIQIASYFEDFLELFPPRPTASGTLLIEFPSSEKTLAAIAVRDIGKLVAQVIAHRSDFVGHTLDLVGEERPFAEYAEVMSQELGRTVLFESTMPQVPTGELERSRDAAGRRDANLRLCRSLVPEMVTFREWVRENRISLLQTTELVH